MHELLFFFTVLGDFLFVPANGNILDDVSMFVCRVPNSKTKVAILRRQLQLLSLKMSSTLVITKEVQLRRATNFRLSSPSVREETWLETALSLL